MVADIRPSTRVRRRWVTIVAAVLAVGATAVVRASPPTSSLPSPEPRIASTSSTSSDRPRRGGSPSREQLHSEGVADDILISVPTDGEQSAAGLSTCQKAYVSCVHPEPFTTAGEMSVLNERYGAGATAIVITFTPHVSRTRFIAGRCAGAEVTVLAVPTSLDLGQWIYQFAYQTGGFAKALVVGCP